MALWVGATLFAVLWANTIMGLSIGGLLELPESAPRLCSFAAKAFSIRNVYLLAYDSYCNIKVLHMDAIEGRS